MTVLAGQDPREEVLEAGPDGLRVVADRTEGVSQHVGHALHLVDVDDLAAARSAAMVQCHHRGRCRRPTAQIAGLIASRLEGWLVGRVGHLVVGALESHAACVPGDELAPLVMPVGAALSEGADTGHDQLIVAGGEAFVAEGQGFQPSGREVGDEKVGLIGEPAKPIPWSFVVQIEKDAALAGVVVEELTAPLSVGPVAGERPQRPARITVRRLDLYDVGPQVGEELRAKRTGDAFGHFDDAKVRKRPFRHGSLHETRDRAEPPAIPGPFPLTLDCRSSGYFSVTPQRALNTSFTSGLTKPLGHSPRKTRATS